MSDCKKVAVIMGSDSALPVGNDVKEENGGKK
jgi:hypothetical protein